MPRPPGKTCKRYNAPGDVHSPTFWCFQRRRFLDADRSREWLIKPVRRGLCKLASEWLWSSAADCAGLRQGPLRIDSGSVPMMVR